MVHVLHSDGNAVVRYFNSRVFLLNADTLTKVRALSLLLSMPPPLRSPYLLDYQSAAFTV